jgi:E3 ubiquitin-protein ligase RNF144
MSLRETDKAMNANISSEHIPTDNSHPSASQLSSRHQLPHLKVVAPNLRLREIIRLKNEPSSARKLEMPPPSSPRKSARDIGNNSSQGHFMCLICMNQKLCNDKLYVCKCEHWHDYCEDCINQYTLYRINQFQEVTCPNPSCDIPLDTSLPFFQQLPPRIQERYHHVHQFHLTHQDDNSKLCPADRCDGVIRKDSPEERVMVCNTCKGAFCSECLLMEHEGDCDAFQVHFLENNLNYRKCQCGIIIEKQEGCNHVTCICGHDFCYLCGESWTSDHDKPHDSNGKVMSSVKPRASKDNPSYRQMERTESDA